VDDPGEGMPAPERLVPALHTVELRQLGVRLADQGDSLAYDGQRG
jgi:hypothetical protein